LEGKLAFGDVEKWEEQEAKERAEEVKTNAEAKTRQMKRACATAALIMDRAIVAINDRFERGFA
jgi:hypothetical protein